MTTNIQTFHPAVASQNWTRPSGATSDSMTRLRFQAGGGAGGGAGPNSSGEVSGGNGGSAGNYCELWILTLDLAAFCSVNVGKGGQGVPDEPGEAGESTTFLSDAIEIEVFGGLGGSLQGFSTSDLPRLGTGTPPNLTGDGVVFVGLSGADALIAIGSGGGPVMPMRGDFVRGGEGGGSYLGGRTRMSTTNSVGRVGNLHGGGGGGAANNAGASTALRGGHGRDGIIVIETHI